MKVLKFSEEELLNGKDILDLPEGESCLFFIYCNVLHLLQRRCTKFTIVK